MELLGAAVELDNELEEKLVTTGEARTVVLELVVDATSLEELLTVEVRLATKLDIDEELESADDVTVALALALTGTEKLPGRVLLPG